MRSFCGRSMITTSQPASPREIVEDAHAHFLDRRRQQVFGPTARTSAAPSVVQRVDVRAGDARAQDVADDGDVAGWRKILLVMTDGVHVEQALRRVRVPPVAGIDHMDVGAPEAAQVLDDQVGRARTRRGARRTCRRACA